MVSINDRFAINAAIERLVDDGATFDPADAALLIEKVPFSTRPAEVSFTYRDEGPRNGIEGYAPGIGNVPSGPEKREKTTGILADVTRIGGYKLIHVPGAITIDLMWADTKLDLEGMPEEGQSAVLVYDRRSKRPKALKAARVVPLDLTLWPYPKFQLNLRFVKFVPWKTPADPGSPAALEAARKLQEQSFAEGQDRSEFVGNAALRAC